MHLHVLSNSPRPGRKPGEPDEDRRADELRRALEQTIEGEVRFAPSDRALYATDSSNYRQIPIGVVVPRSTEDVVAAVEQCRRFDVPIVSRGGGTSLAGQCCNVAVVIDHSKYLHRVVDIDPDRRLARVEPGCVLDTLRHRAIREHGLTFGPDPSTHAWCTLGGMIGNNSCGVHSVMAGRTSDCTESLDILTYDGQRLTVGATDEAEGERRFAVTGREGEIYRALEQLRGRYAPLIRERYPKIPRRVSGYNLDELLPERGFHVARSLVGTEGTCVVVLGATLKLVPWPKKRAMVVLGYPDIYSAGDHIPQVMESGPIGLEGIDKKLIQRMRERGMHTQETHLLEDAGGWLIVEFGGPTKREADDQARRLMSRLERVGNAPTMQMFDGPEEEHEIWDIRESGLGATAFGKNKPDAWEGWEDAAVPPERVGEYLRAFRKLLDRYDYDTVMYGHFGQGCIHCRINFDLYTAEGIDKYRGFIDEAADLVVSLGGSLSGEHGDGQSKAALLPKMYGTELVEAFREFKRIWDPAGRMNPGKVVDPNPPTSHLRLGTDYEPRRVETFFSYPDDQGVFARAALRCVGVGKCRRREDAFMCPTYRVTSEEKHTTRGRAHMLFEMMRGDFLSNGWRDRGVLEALDLCIGCKGCKKECPVNVDMATYKSEFLAHHYQGRVRPRSHYSMGLIGWWARAATMAPGVANFFGQGPGLGALAKWLAGVAPERPLPRFASERFTRWFRARPERTHGRAIVLWPDVFNDSFHPGSLKAGVEVLESLGYRVVLPPRRLPAARPAIHYGMLRLARAQLERMVEILRPFARDGLPIVGLEPSDIAVLREELTRLLPGDEDAKRISNLAKLFGEVVRDHKDELPRLGGRAILHIHCHEKSVLDPDATREVLRAMEVEFEEPEKGCCGMAGSFGFEREHYPVSMAIGEQSLLPTVRGAKETDWLVAPGFSCRTQIHDATGRLPMHLAELVNSALQRGGERR